MNDTNALLAPLLRLHAIIRDKVVEVCERAAVEDLASIDRDDEGDTIYAVDRVSEELLIDFVEREISVLAPACTAAASCCRAGPTKRTPRGASSLTR